MESATSTRGLGWRGEVGMTELSGWEYGTRTKEVAEVLGGDELRALSKLAIAGGVLPEGTDLATLAVSFTAASAGASYSPLDKQVLLLADQVEDDSLLTHEFVHALQDQHFDLLKLLLVRPFNFDRTEAGFALIEGDAMNVQRRMEGGETWARRSLEEIARQEDERFGQYRKEIGAMFPPLLTETFIFRYRDGARFIETLRRNRPSISIDDVFRRPPLSSEQILHPEKYLPGPKSDAPREVQLDERAFAVGGWRLMASTPLGEIGVRGLLLAKLSGKEAARAAAGWGGDRACLFERKGGHSAPLFVWKTLWDKPEDAQEFFRAYNMLQQRGNGIPGDNKVPSGNAAQMIWRDAGRVTIVWRDSVSSQVIIIRGGEADISAALELARTSTR